MATERRPKLKAKAPPARRVAVMVLGAPRSGTSAISHMISRLGVDFGDPARFVDSERHRHNPIFFELESLNALNADLLRSCGREYTDFDQLVALDPGDLRLQHAIAACAALVRSEFADSATIGLKDPRFCFTGPVWWEAFTALGYEVVNIFCLRDEAEIVRSNALVNGWSEARNRRILNVSQGVAAVALRGRRVCVVDYDTAVAEPAKTAARLAGSIGLSKASVADAAAVIDPGLRHTASVPVARDADLDAVLAGIADAYEPMIASLSDIGITELIDRRRAELQEARKVVASLSAEISALAPPAAPCGVEAALARIDDLGKRLDQRDSAATAYEALRIAHERRIADLEAAIFDRDKLLRASAGKAAETELRVAELTREGEDREASRREAHARVGALEAAIAAANDELARRDAAVSDLQQTLDQLRTELRLTSSRLIEASAEAAAMKYRGDALERSQLERLATLATERAHTEARLAEATAAASVASASAGTLREELEMARAALGDRNAQGWRRWFASSRARTR